MRLFLILILLATQNVLAKGIVGITIDPSIKSNADLIQDDLKPFISDGCTDYSNGTDENPTLWLSCCLEHDSKYWLGGTSEARGKADDQLHDCVLEKSKQTWRADAVYAAVRLFGGPERNTDYRWGYGWTRLRYYKPLSAEEMKTAETMYGPHLELIEELIKSGKAYVPSNSSHDYEVPLDYNFCEEQVLVYLKKYLKTATTIKSSRAWEPTWAPQPQSRSREYHLLVNVDICDGSVDFQFDNLTDPSTCRHDYYYANEKNKVISVKIPKNCKKDFEQPNALRQLVF